MSVSRFPRRILVAPDKFKGTLTAREAADAIVRGLRQRYPEVQCHPFALADGGEGFARALGDAVGGRTHSVATVDALGRPCTAEWIELNDGRTAAVDLASASGLAQLPPRDRDPTATSTAGTGRILRHLVDAGFHRIIVGLGGSATNDGGIGLAAALGFQFLDTAGRSIALTGGGLLQLARIVPPPERPVVELVAATDVDHPLLGPHGAARVFSPQKGADPQQVERLEQGLHHLARVTQELLGQDDSQRPGAGAAGGAGFGLMSLLGAHRRSGFAVLREAAGLDDLIRQHDLVITGEGCLDDSSAGGKAAVALAQLARRLGVPTWGVFGRVEARDLAARFARWAELPPSPGGLEALAPAEHARRVTQAVAAMARAAADTAGTS